MTLKERQAHKMDSLQRQDTPNRPDGAFQLLEAPKRSNYAASLMTICSAQGLISAEQSRKIMEELFEEFAEIAAQYTFRESSSLRRELAQQLYSSVLYRADVYLLSLGSDAEAVKALASIPMKRILELGRDELLRIHEGNRAIFKRAYNSRLDISIPEYRHIMLTAFDRYYQRYSARFNARSICTDIDYPLLGRPAYAIEVEGAMFIREYYYCIALENEFCQMLDIEGIRRLLRAEYGGGFGLIGVNICEAVCRRVFGNILLGRSGFSLSTRDGDGEEIKALRANMSGETLLRVILGGLKALRGEFPNEEVFRYISGFVKQYIK